MFGGKDDNQKDQKTAKTFQYRCTKNCTFAGFYYRAGEIISLPEKKEVPHFEFVEEIKISDK